MGTNRAGHVLANMTLSIVKSRNLIQSYTGEEVAGMVLGVIFIFLLIFVAICVVVLRSKSHYEDVNSVNRVNQISEQNRCQSDERKLLSVHMNHNSYVTSVVTSNHLEMKSISDGDANHRTNDNKSSDSNEDNNCLMDNINDNHNCFKTNSDMTTDADPSGDHLSSAETSSRAKTFNSLPNSDNKQLDSNYSKDFDQLYTNDRVADNRDNRDVTAVCVPTTSNASSTHTKPNNYPKSMELLRRRASDITDELNKRFAQKRAPNGRQGSVKEGSQPTVRFNNNATIYNYQCQRFGHSMESLDSDSNGYNHSNNGYEERNSYNYVNGGVGTEGAIGAANNRSHVGFSYTMRPNRAVGKHYRRSGGSLAALLGIDARDSPDEGLGDEREYETDILD